MKGKIWTPSLTSSGLQEFTVLSTSSALEKLLLSPNKENVTEFYYEVNVINIKS